MSWWEFAALVAGLSEHSVWRNVAGNEPVEISSEEARSVIASM